MWLGLFNHLHNSLLFHHLNWSHVLCQTIYNHVNDLHPFSALPVYTQFNQLCTSDVWLNHLFTFGLYTAASISPTCLSPQPGCTPQCVFASSVEKKFVPFSWNRFLAYFPKVLRYVGGVRAAPFLPNLQQQKYTSHCQICHFVVHEGHKGTVLL